MMATSSSSSSRSDSSDSSDAIISGVVGGVVGGVVVLAAATFFVIKKRGLACSPAELQAEITETSKDARDVNVVQNVDESQMPKPAATLEMAAV